MQDNHKTLDELKKEAEAIQEEKQSQSNESNSSSDEGDERVDKDNPQYQTNKDEEGR